VASWGQATPQAGGGVTPKVSTSEYRVSRVGPLGLGEWPDWLCKRDFQTMKATKKLPT
jgi:hypothetical protein